MIRLTNIEAARQKMLREKLQSLNATLTTFIDNIDKLSVDEIGEIEFAFAGLDYDVTMLLQGRGIKVTRKFRLWEILRGRNA